MKTLKAPLSSSIRNKNAFLKGFTLLEVVIALGILASIMIVLTSSLKGNLRRVKKAEIKTQAVHLLQKKITEIEVLYRNDIANLPQDLQKGDFEDKKLKRFSWEWETNEFQMPDIAKLFTQEESIVDETTLAVITQMRQYLEDSIREVKVTLIYKASPKAKPQKFSVATVLVDYNTPLNINLGAGIPTPPQTGGNN